MKCECLVRKHKGFFSMFFFFFARTALYCISLFAKTKSVLISMHLWRKEKMIPLLFWSTSTSKHNAWFFIYLFIFGIWLKQSCHFTPNEVSHKLKKNLQNDIWSHQTRCYNVSCQKLRFSRWTAEFIFSQTVAVSSCDTTHCQEI